MAESRDPSGIADRSIDRLPPSFPRSERRFRAQSAISPHDEREIIPARAAAAAGKNMRSLPAVPRLRRRRRILTINRGSASEFLLCSPFVASCLNAPPSFLPALQKVFLSGENGVLKSPISPSFAVPSVPYLANDPLWTPRRL